MGRGSGHACLIPCARDWTWLHEEALRAAGRLQASHAVVGPTARHTADTSEGLGALEGRHRQAIMQEWAVDTQAVWFLLGVAHLCQRTGPRSPAWDSTRSMCLLQSTVTTACATAPAAAAATTRFLSWFGTQKNACL